MKPRLLPAAAVAALLPFSAVRSAEPPPFELTVDSLMRGPKLVGYPPSGLRWSGDSKRLYFEQRPPDEDEPATFVVSRDGSGLRRLSDDERKSAPPAEGVWDDAHRRILFVEHGDVAIVDSVARARRQVTRTAEADSDPRWARRGSHVTFTRGDGVFVVPASEANGDVVVQLVEGGPKKEKKPKRTDSQRFLEDEEQRLIEHVKRSSERREKREAEDERAAPAHFDLRPRESIAGAALAPDDRHAYLLVARKAEKARRPAVPDYVTESAYTETLEARFNVGDQHETQRLAVLDLTTRESRLIRLEGVSPDVEPTDKTEEEEAESADKEESKAQASSGDKPKPRELRWELPAFSPDGARALVEVRAADNKDRWLALVDPAAGVARPIDRQQDDAWVNGLEPGFGWLADSRGVWFTSESTGWMHLYVADATTSGAQARALTSGKFELAQVALAPDKKSFFVTSNEAEPGQRHVYRVPLDGGSRTPLTAEPGAWEAEVSPDASLLGLVHSAANSPPEVYLAQNRPGAEARRITLSTSAEWRAFPWTSPPVVHFQARDGANVPARLFTPESVGARREPQAPGVVFVHGAGHLQNAHRYWSGYYREYLFHHLLVARGYVVLDVDYRGSAGYGRDWRTAIYRHMGGRDLDDVVDGARYLVEQQGVDPKRVGLYGGSYGGFLTLMALFTSPDTFAAGAALRPVTDWAHYNHGYTSNILNQPQDDAEAYRRSSPIYFAEGLKGSLLICHGLVDVNVHAQDSIRLAQRLIELRKQNWELALYPAEDHAFQEETSWADEYRRILALFERTIGTGAAWARLDEAYPLPGSEGEP